MSATSIVGPPLMTNTFAFFTDTHAPIYFPEAPMIMGAVFMLISTFLARSSLKRTLKKEPAIPEAGAESTLVQESSRQ
jgi:DHA1 family tetracycline resistance protein-like MFS transporter